MAGAAGMIGGMLVTVTGVTWWVTSLVA